MAPWWGLALATPGLGRRYLRHSIGGPSDGHSQAQLDDDDDDDAEDKDNNVAALSNCRARDSCS